MNTIEAETFQERCMALLDGLAAALGVNHNQGRQAYRQGRALRLRQLADLIGSLRHKVKIQGDIRCPERRPPLELGHLDLATLTSSLLLSKDRRA